MKKTVYSPVRLKNIIRTMVAAGFLGVSDSRKIHATLLEQKSVDRSLISRFEDSLGKKLPVFFKQKMRRLLLFELKAIYAVESINIMEKGIDLSRIPVLVSGLVPIELCRLHKFLPLSKTDGNKQVLTVAMIDPENLDAQDDLIRVLNPLNIILKKVVFLIEDYLFLMAIVDKGAAGGSNLQRKIDFQKDLLEIKVSEVNPGSIEPELQIASAETRPVIQLVDKIIIQAIEEGASDIHVEPQENSLRIRYRKDGLLQETIERFPGKLTQIVTARFKIMADLDVAERREPQDGRIRRRYKNRNIDFRVSTLPGRYGEKVVLRILESASDLNLKTFISNQGVLDLVEEMIVRPFGFILITGPTGSGKTTTLFSVLAQLNTDQINMSTVEDPIEYSIPGIHQVQIIREKGLDFARILRTLLRQDPDVILIGEIRDAETAEIAVEAALTGHLVLSTLHTNDSVGAIARLDELEVRPVLLADSLIGVIAQRLVRRVCQECRQTYVPSEKVLRQFGISQERADQSHFHETVKKRIDQEYTCRNCNSTGYKGRIGVYEVLKINDKIRTLIGRNSLPQEIREAAEAAGMQSLLSYGIDLVCKGLTTFEEIERVLLFDSMQNLRKEKAACQKCFAELPENATECPYCLSLI